MTETTSVIEEAELSTLTKEEVSQLSKQLQERQKEIESLRRRMQQAMKQVESEERKVTNQMAALNGEQRFTGAREPASLQMANDYSTDKFYFVPARECNHADRRKSGESTFEFAARKMGELADIALDARKQRGFTLEEATRLYKCFSTYKEVVSSDHSYRVIDSVVGITYYSQLCGSHRLATYCPANRFDRDRIKKALRQRPRRSGLRNAVRTSRASNSVIGMEG